MATAPDALLQLGLLRTALDEARDRAGTEEPWFTWASTWFTDNVVVGCPVVEYQDVEQTLGHTQVQVAYMMLLMLDAGFLARGAISFGAHYMDETFVFGPALIEAVNLEKATEWPRVALTPLAAELNREVVRRFYADPALSPQAGALLCDEDGTVFIDHLNTWFSEEDDPRVMDRFLPRYKVIVERELAALPSGSRRRRKWKWLADYHNYAMTENLRAPEPFIIDAGPPDHGFSRFVDTI
jgi:hypothetical protein